MVIVSLPQTRTSEVVFFFATTSAFIFFPLIRKYNVDLTFSPDFLMCRVFEPELNIFIRSPSAKELFATMAGHFSEILPKKPLFCVSCH